MAKSNPWDGDPPPPPRPAWWRRIPVCAIISGLGNVLAFAFGVLGLLASFTSNGNADMERLAILMIALSIWARVWSKPNG